MKTRQLSKSILTLLLLLFTVSVSYSQTIYEDYQDGKIWFKIKKSEKHFIVKQATREGNIITNDDENMKLSSMPFLRNVFVNHTIKRLSRPFPKAYSSQDLLNTYLIEFDDIENIEAFINELEASGGVDYAEKVPLYKTTYTPNDQLHNTTNMWGLFQIQAEQAWNIGTGNANVVVATVDNAIQITHPDLVNQIWTNPGEIPNNGIDDDGNGYIDDVNGYDVGDNDNNPNPPSTQFNHGTHVAGTTGAETDNSIGVSSIGFGISIMPVKATRNNAGSNSVTNGYDGIYYAAVSGADVINCSWGGTGFSTTGQNIVNFAWNNGSIVVAAAGNDNVNNDNTPHYPSNLNNVISVASSTTNDVKSNFSNYGNTIDITAPGSNIASTVPNNTYQFMSGTSMASPMVAGLLGLMKSLNPTMPNTALINCMYSTADNIDGANPSFIGRLGAGRINAFQAMQCVAASLSNAPVAEFTANVTTINAGSSVTFTDLSTFSPTTWSWNFDNQSLGGVVPATANTQGPHTVTYNNVGLYEVSLTVTNANGNDTETKTNYINVVQPGTCEIIDMDTTSVPFHFGWTPVIYTPAAPQTGFVAGTNSFNDRAKLNYYNSTQTSGFNYLIGTYIWFARAATNTPTKTVDVNVYDGTGGTVGALLGTKTLSMSYILANAPGIPFIEFDNPISLPVSGEVFVGVRFANLNIAVGDTLAIVTNTQNESNPNTAWEQWSDNTWHPYNGAGAWGLSVSHYFFPWLTNDTTAISLTATPTSICAGEMVHYDATGSTSQDTLLWSFPGMNPTNSSNVIDSVLYSTPGTYTTYLEIIGGGCSRYRIDSVTITVNPAPTISITSTADTICAGSSVTLTATGGTSYLWTPGGQTTNAITVSPTSTTTYNVAGTSGGCTDNGFITIYVMNLPTVANATVTPSTTICQGTNVVFDGTSSTNASNYNWSFPQGNPSISSSSNPFETVSFGSPGTHSYSLQITSACGTDTYNGTVTVEALPTVTANASATTICAGDPVTLTGNGATSYTWDNGVTNGVAFTPTTTTTYTVTGTGANSCQNTAQVTVTVNPAPTVTANATSTSICAGQSVTLTGSGNASSYTWNNGVTNGVAFTPSTTTTYTVTGTTGSCSNTDQITVTVNTAPTVTANTTSTSICAGQSVTLTGSGNASSYTWDNGVTNGVAFTPSTTTTYTVTGTTGSCSNTDQITITVNPAPTVTANATSTSICAGQSVTLTGSGSASSYTWDNGVTDGVAFTPTATTTYTVTGTIGSCSNTDQITVTVNQLPSAIVTFTPNTNICENVNIQFDASNSVGASSYNWSFPQGNPSMSSSTIANPLVSFSVAGTHNFAVVISNSCGTDTHNGSIVVDICNSIDDLNNGKSMIAYFDNINNNISISYENIAQGTYNLNILNSLGQIIISTKLNISNNESVITMPFNESAKGIYFINIYNNDAKFNSKFMK
ncbi:MAG: S8 family serine peptidase [Vicingaceae bacterium]|nr:S8 family serine peptidase [Vicingaceae bacterium]